MDISRKRAIMAMHQTVSARISELRFDGLIRRAGRRATRSGCTAWTYEVTQ